jgi:hypothetical protein
MRLRLLTAALAGGALALAALAAPPPAGPDGAAVRLSRAGICHCPGGASYDRTRAFTPFDTLGACLGAGGREPRRGQGACPAASGSPATPPYDRARFGGWADPDGDCRDTRAETLALLSSVPVTRSPDGCRVERGRWIDPYTGDAVLDAGRLDIDHVVPLAWAWDHGASGWDDAARAALATDPANLLAVEAGLNRAKGDASPLGWLPPDAGFRCQYVLRFARVARTHGLAVPPGEAAALGALRAAVCG